MSLSIYLFFDGNCADAFDFYQSVFGGEVIVRSTFGEAPPDMPVADSDKDRIMHISLQIGDGVLMGSDAAKGFGEKPEAGSNFSISYTPKTREEADEIFPRLTEGGEISMPLQDTFWGAYFGQGKDKFGIGWMLNVDTTEQ